MGIFKVVLVLMVLVVMVLVLMVLVEAVLVVVGIVLIEGVANVVSIPIKSYPGSVVPPAMFVNNIDIYFIVSLLFSFFYIDIYISMHFPFLHFVVKTL